MHLWRVDLDAESPDHVVSAEEQRRGDRRRDELGRARFLASRAWLRVILGGCAGIDPGNVGFATTARGKPTMLDGGGLGFSLSRSAGVALVAVTRGRAVGVDVERVRPDIDHADLAERFFSAAEAEALRHLQEPDRREGFFRLWVRKEAVVKASGAGLTDGVGHLDVRTDRVAGRWTVASIDAGPGFAAAVAVEGTLGPLLRWRVPDDGAG